MKIVVKLHTLYRKYLPEGSTGGTCRMDVPEGSKAGDVPGHFSIKLTDRPVIFINGEKANLETPLRESDEVSVFPLAGGG